jgi:hypothetical protein
MGSHRECPVHRFSPDAYVLAFVEHDTATMTRELDAAVALPEGAWASTWQPRVSAFGGRLANALEEFRRSVAVTSHANLTELSGLQRRKTPHRTRWVVTASAIPHPYGHGRPTGRFGKTGKTGQIGKTRPHAFHVFVIAGAIAAASDVKMILARPIVAQVSE